MTIDTQDLLPQGCYVILHIRAGAPYPDPIASPQIASDSRFELAPDIWIERLGQELATNIQRACEPADYKIDRDVDDRHLYAFVIKIPEKRPPRKAGQIVLQHEDIIPLFTVVALSRLVRPTSTGERYCAKIYPPVGSDSAIQMEEILKRHPDSAFIADGSPVTVYKGKKIS